MTVLDAAYKILSEASGPMHYRDITKQILAKKLWETDGKTPWYTLNAAITVDIKKKGASSRFKRTSPGVFALTEASTAPSPKPKKSAKKKSPKKTKPGKTVSFSEAAIRVLNTHGDRKPMHYRDITQIALANGWIETHGLTPEATMYAQILSENARKRKRGLQPRFIKHGKGLVGLSAWESVGIPLQIERHNREVRKKLHGGLMKIEPAEFEELVGALLAAIGFEEVEVTKKSGDGGIDVRGTLVVADVIRTRMAVQVKRWKNNVQAPTVQQVRGSLGAHEQGLIITTSDFSPGARQEAARPDATPVALMSGKQLVEVLFEQEIGAKRTAYDLFELADTDLAD